MEVVELFQNSEMEQYTSYVEIGRNVLAICSALICICWVNMSKDTALGVI